MTWLKRGFFFMAVNLAVIAMMTIIINLFGLEPYIEAYGQSYTGLFIFCLFWGTGGAFISLWMSKWIAKKMMGVQIVDQRGSYAHLVSRVHSMARQAGISKMPEVGIYDSPEFNAFATGPSKNNSLVAVSTGLLNGMTQDEVEGVLAHEVSHIANGDMVTMTLIQGIVNAFVMFAARIVAQILDNAMRDDNGRGGLGYFGYFICVMVLQIAFGLLGSMITGWFSRHREYRADAGAAVLSSRDKMIAALKRLQMQYDQIPVADSKDTMAAFRISSKQSGLMALLATHPPLEKRIEALVKMRAF